MRETAGIVDADLLAPGHHKFPNLASMKLSAWEKERGNDVRLVLDWAEALNSRLDRIYVSKVFTATPVPDWVYSDPRVSLGGTGFFFDKAPPLPDEIEHHMPDYHLYDEWVERQRNSGISRTELVYYTDFSIGFLTRGCIRQCKFCVNQNLKRCVRHSPVSEFFDPDRKYLCFLDDNFFACPDWREIIAEVKATGRRFRFKQGLDERLLNTDEKVNEVSSWKHYKELLFAFDNLADRDVVVSVLERFQRLHPEKLQRIRCFVLVGFDRNGKYDDDFWLQDIRDMLERIRILGSYKVIPYIMRFEKVYESPYKSFYGEIAKYCNVVQYFKGQSIANCLLNLSMGEHSREYWGRPDLYLKDGRNKRMPWRHLDWFAAEHPEIVEEYFHCIGWGWEPQETWPTG